MKPECSFAEIAKALNISVDAAQRLYYSALEKCQAWCQQKGIKVNDILPD